MYAPRTIITSSVLYLYKQDDGSDYEKYLKDYVTFQINAMGESTVCNCLGEPKY